MCVSSTTQQAGLLAPHLLRSSSPLEKRRERERSNNSGLRKAWNNQFETSVGVENGFSSQRQPLESLGQGCLAVLSMKARVREPGRSEHRLTKGTRAPVPVKDLMSPHQTR